jgi:hypothetical protein
MEGLVFEAFVLVCWMVGFHLVPMDFENFRYDPTLKKGVNIGVRVKNDTRSGEVFDRPLDIGCIQNATIFKLAFQTGRTLGPAW